MAGSDETAATETAAAETAAAETAAAELVWTAHPARQHRMRTVFAVGAIAALAVLAAILMQSPWWAALTVLLMVLMLNRFFFPSRFRIDAEGLTASYPLRTQHLKWSEGRRFECGRHGALVSTRATPTRFEGRRSLHVLFGPERQAAIDCILAHLPEGVG